MTTKCIIVDDEPLAAEVIKSHLGKFDELELIGVCNDAIEAFNFLNKHKVDLMFLDIHMPEMKGTELIKNLPKPPKVIFTTAYREYAIESYELNVLDYLLKPIPFDRFLQAINKFFEQNNLQAQGDISFHENNKTEEGFIYVREKNQVHKILTKNIRYIESLCDYVKIYNSGKNTTIRHTITALEKMLPSKEFIRIHRSFIVNLDQITSFTSHSVFIQEKELPIGPVYKNEVFKALKYEKFGE